MHISSSLLTTNPNMTKSIIFWTKKDGCLVKLLFMKTSNTLHSICICAKFYDIFLILLYFADNILLALFLCDAYLKIHDIFIKNFTADHWRMHLHDEFIYKCNYTDLPISNFQLICVCTPRIFFMYKTIKAETKIYI